jgi:hypothetical protein
MNHEPSSMTLSDDERRLLRLWAADCAERVLPPGARSRLLTPVWIGAIMFYRRLFCPTTRRRTKRDHERHRPRAA